MSIRKPNVFFIYSIIFTLIFSSFASLGGIVRAEQPTQPNFFLEVDGTSSDLVTVIVELEEVSILEAKHNGTYQTRNN
nr:hypothetical protein [Anaerobacillus sp. CMMVII]